MKNFSVQPPDLNNWTIEDQNAIMQIFRYENNKDNHANFLESSRQQNDKLFGQPKRIGRRKPGAKHRGKWD